MSGLLAFKKQPGVAESPFLEARRVWSEDWERLAKQRAILVLLLIVSLVAHGAQALLSLRLAARAEQGVVYVETDRLGHSVVYPIAIASEPSTTLVASELARFIEGARTITPDASLQLRLVTATYARISENAKTFLDIEYNRPGRDYRKVGDEKRVIVEVRSVLPIDQVTQTGDAFQTWQVRWSEEHRRHGEGQGVFEDWVARIDFVLRPPMDVNAALENVAGLYVTGIHWTRESEDRFSG